jgi:hypothetical protein
VSGNPQAAFYCVADERYFLGAVGLINSLRLVGHDEPAFVLDCGLTAAQRELLSGSATVVEAPADVAPWLAKTVAPTAHPARAMVLIDADMIATRSISPLIERALEGAVVAFENESDRHVAEWGDLLDLPAPRRERYVSSGLFALGGDEGAEVLALLDDRQRHVDVEAGLYGRDEAGYAFRYPEQDVLNAILSSRPDPGRVERLPSAQAATPPYTGLSVSDLETLRCAYRDGTEPYVIHQFVRKPWLERMHHSVYSQLLARLLCGDDVAIRVPEAEVPHRLRRGVGPSLERAALSARDLSRWYASEAVRRMRGRTEAG